MNFFFQFYSTITNVEPTEDLEIDEGDNDEEIASICATHSLSRSSSSASSEVARSNASSRSANHSHTSSTTSSETHKKRKRDEESNEDTILKLLMNRLVTTQMPTGDVDDELSQFLVGLGSVMKKFPPLVLAQIKRAMANMVCDKEVELTMHHQIGASSSNLHADDNYEDVEFVIDDAEVEILDVDEAD